jgi:general secretion pathway protein K
MRSRGVALVAALLVVAIAASLATHLLWRSSVWIGQVEALRDLAQARRHADAAADWACAVLADDAANSAVDHPQEPWARQIPPMEAEGGRIGGQLFDEQVRWNLNNLVGADGKINEGELAVYRRLLRLLNLPGNLAETLADWMDTDAEPRSGGGEDEFYLARSPSTRTAGGTLGAWEDLLLVKGYDRAVLERLQPHATVLPHTTQLNVNGATAIALEAAHGGISGADAEQLVLQGLRVPFRDVADFRTRLGKDLPTGDDARLAARSRYFSLRLNASYGKSNAEVRALIDRGKGWPVVVWKRFG